MANDILVLKMTLMPSTMLLNGMVRSVRTWIQAKHLPKHSRIYTDSEFTIYIFLQSKTNILFLLLCTGFTEWQLRILPRCSGQLGEVPFRRKIR